MAHESLRVARLRELVSALSAAGSTTARGRRLQDLVAFLVEPLAGVEITDENIFNIGRTEEKMYGSGTPEKQPVCRLTIATCRSSARTRRPRPVRLSGDALGGGHEEIRNQLKKGTRIVVITAADVLSLGEGPEFLELLQARHAELRHRQGYVSI